MGAGASTLGGPSGPEVGKFRLTPDQQRNLDIVSNLFQLLMDKNNLMDLGKLVSTQEDACSDLIIALSDKVDKEFQRLKFASTKAMPGTLIDTAFISDAQYRMIQKAPIREEMCANISKFLLQFVLMISALAASVSIPEGVPKMGEALSKVFVVEFPRDSQLTLGEIPERLLSSFQQYRAIREVEGSLGKVFGIGAYFLHRDGYIYRKSEVTNGESPVFAIELEYVTEQTFMPGQTSSPLNVQGQGQGQGQGQPTGMSSKSTSSVWGLPPSLQSEAEKEYIKSKTALDEEKLKFAKSQELLKAQTELDQKRSDAKIPLRTAIDRRDEIKPLLDLTLDQRRIFNDFDEIARKYKLGKLNAINNQKQIFDIVNAIVTHNKEFDEFNNTILALQREIDYPSTTIERIASRVNALNNTLFMRDVIQYEDKKNKIKSDMLELKNLIQKKLEPQAGAPQGPTLAPFVPPKVAEVPLGAQAQFAAPREQQLAIGNANSVSASNRFPSIQSVSTMKPPQGGAIDYLIVTLKSPEQQAQEQNTGFLTQSRPSQKEFAKFIMDFAGNTYDYQFFLNRRGQVSRTDATSFERRLKTIFEKADRDNLPKYSLKKLGEEESQEYLKDFQQKFGMTREFITSFQEYGKKLSPKSEEMQSPAAYRAYLLMSETDQSKLSLKLCKDSWEGSIRNVPAYALFGTLYRDLLEDSKTYTTSNSQFKNLPSTILADDAEDPIWGKQFKHDIEGLEEVCETGIAATQKPLLAILQGGYSKLKGLYMTHLQNVLKFLNTVFVIDREFTDILKMPGGFQSRSPILRLHPRFARDNSAMELRRAVDEARKMLDLHYVQVETEYAKTLEALKTARSTAPPPVTATGGAGKYATRMSGTRRGSRSKKRYISFRKKRVARR
jgi:hypothetical protein